MFTHKITIKDFEKCSGISVLKWYIKPVRIESERIILDALITADNVHLFYCLPVFSDIFFSIIFVVDLIYGLFETIETICFYWCLAAYWTKRIPECFATSFIIVELGLSEGIIGFKVIRFTL